MTYWQTHGLNDPALDPYGDSLALFGLPLTRPQMVTNSSGDTVLTQWFERARFEWHPNKPDQFKVLLGLLGNELRAPSGAPVPGDLATARTTLVTYFSALHEGRYREAVQFYGGSYETLRDWNPDVAADHDAVLLERGCQSNGLRCLTVRRIVQEEALSGREFRFVVEFSNRDGSLFRHATRTQFTYTVTKIGDRFLVEGLPVYVS